MRLVITTYNFFLSVSGDILGIVLGSLCGVLVLVAVVVFFVAYRQRRNRRKSRHFEYYDLDSDAITKSAPISRFVLLHS